MSAQNGDSISFLVLGHPVPKGSTRSFKHAVTGSVVTLEQGRAKIHRMQARIALEARAAGVTVHAGPVAVLARFSFLQPKSHLRRDGSLRPGKPAMPTTHGRNDLDKLLRTVFDALTGIAWNDDSQVVEAHCEKVWDTFEGIAIQVTALHNQP